MRSILLVDDERINLDLLAAIVGHLGHRLLEAADGESALALVRSERPDLVITDVLMPRMDGYELARQIRSDPRTRSTRIIFCTAHYSEDEARRLAKACGVDLVLAKPFEPESLIAAVRDLMGSATPVAADDGVESFDREHARLLTDKLSAKVDELRATNERLSALIDLNLQLGSELDVNRLLDHFCGSAREVVGARQAVAGIVDPDAKRMKRIFTSGMDAATAEGMGVPDPSGASLRAVVSSGRSSRAVNPTGDATALGFERGFPPIHSWLAAPISSPTRIYGWLGLIDREGAGAFSEEDERLACILASQVGRVYQNGSLYAEAMRHAAELEVEIAERRQLEHRQAVLLAVEHALSTSATLPAAASSVLAAIGGGLSWQAGALLAREPGTGRLDAIATWSADGRAPDSWEPSPRAAALCEPPTAAGGLPPGLAFPIVVDCDVVGVVDGVGAPPPEQIPELAQMLEGIGRTLGQCIERHRAEDALHAAQLRLQHVVTSSPAVLFTLDWKDGGLALSWISANVTALLGWSEADALAPGWWSQRVHAEDLPRVRDAIERHLVARGNLVDAYRFLHADGTYRWLRSEMRVVSDVEGTSTEIVGSWSDVTERRHLEDQLRQAQKMEAVGCLAGGVAHDFNNLLTVILVSGELGMQDLAPSDPLFVLLDQIRNAGERAAHLTRQLLAFSRKQVLQPVVLDLNVLVRDAESMLRRLIGEDVRLAVGLRKDLWRVRADPGQIEQVIMNLAINSKDAMPLGGAITIETDNVTVDPVHAAQHPDVEMGEHVRLSIADTGSGMDQATLARIFEPFFTTKGERGTGLGLATVFGIVQQSGGCVHVRSEVGVGTTFEIYFPRESAPESSRRSLAAAPHHGGTETIVVVEDEPDVREVISHILLKAGYTVIEAGNGDEALAACADGGPLHLLVTDVVLPGMSGRDLRERLRALAPDLKVLYLSGYTDDAIVQHGVLAAGVPFLNKPFTRESLMRKVREALDARPGDSASSRD